MLYLQTLIFNNIGRFTEEQVFELSNHSNLLLIDGPSGVGKSTIFHALDYLLDVNSIPATQLQSRFTKKPIYVRGIFKYNDQIITVERSKKDGLTIKLPSETISGNVDLAELKLDELIGVPRKLFKKIIHKSQQERGFFLQMTAKQTYEFLIELLGLQPYQDKIELINEKNKNNLQLIDTKASECINLTANIDELILIKNREIAPVCLVDRDLLEQKRLVRDQLSTKLQSLIENKQNQLSQISKPIKGVCEYDLSASREIESLIKEVNYQKNALVKSVIEKRQELSNKLSDKKQQLNKIQYLKTEIQSIVSNVNTFKQQKQHAENNSCPTCNQLWSSNDQKEYINKLDTQIKNLVSDILQKKSKIDQEPLLLEDIGSIECLIKQLQSPDTSSFDIQIAGLQEQLSQEKNKLSNLQKEIDSIYLKDQNLFLQKQKEISEIYDGEINSVKTTLNTVSTDIEIMGKELQNYNLNCRSYKQRMEDIEVNIIQKQQKLSSIQDSLCQLKNNLIIAEEAKRLIKSYTLQIFQETLDTIGETATSILGNVHNMANSSIFFEGCKENKSGTIKDEVNAIITKAGESDIPIKTLSGGERTVIDLAVDLAVIDVIENKVGKGANFFIIDEPFDGLDSEGKEQYLDVLKSLDSGKQIILVDHSPELKEMISDVISIGQ